MSETTETTGGEALARMLAAYEIGPMFGMGGFQLLPFCDAARRPGIDHKLAGAIESGLNTQHVPTIIDVVVTREPGQMLPGADSRTVTVKEGDRVARGVH